jgi:glycerophosphoryl diester phosphodiesterase
MILAPLKDYPFESKTMICAHRGDTSGGATENSIAAVDAALLSGAEMIEIDVQMTHDGIPVCYHDEKLPGAPLAIWQTTYADLRTQGSIDTVPLLEDILRHVQAKVYLNIEMKDYSGYHPSWYVHPLIALVKKYEMHKYSLYSSFRIDFVQALPWDSLSVVIRPTTSIIDYFNARSISPVLLPRRIEQMLPSEIIQYAHATSFACMLEEIDENTRKDILSHKLFLSVYTITEAQKFSEAINKGAKAVVTDIPRELLAYRDSMIS